MIIAEHVEEKKKIKELYNSMGGTIYDLRYSEEQETKYKIVLDSTKFLSTEQGGCKLDIGCGTGLLIKKIRGYVVGTDISSQLLLKAVERSNKETFLVNADAENLPFRSCIFNMLFGITILQNLSNFNKAFSEFERVSTAEGIIVISMIKKALSLQDFLKLVKENLRSYKLLSESSSDWIIMGKTSKKLLENSEDFYACTQMQGRKQIGA